MEIKIERLSPMQCADIILEYLNGGSWDEYIRTNLQNLSKHPSKAEIAGLVEKRMEIQKEKYDKNIQNFLDWWENDGESDYQELSKIMGFEHSKNRNAITWQIGDTFICPRDIENWSFVMSAGAWKWDAINIALHEITHFIWFEKVKQFDGIKHFSQNQDDETYLPFWLLSEIVIDPILNSTEFAKKYEMTWKSYSEFYDITIQNRNLMEYISCLWNKRKSFEDFYKESSSFVYANSKEIYEKYLYYYNHEQNEIEK